MDKIFKLTKTKMDMKEINESDIVHTHRSGKKKSSKTRDIIVQFNGKTTRDSFHGARQKLRYTSDAHRSVYVNEDLTDFRSKLLYDARMLVKKRRLKGAWRQCGNVMVLAEHSRSCAVYNYDDLRISSGADSFRLSDSEQAEEEEAFMD